MKMLTNQEIFDKVATHLLTQGKKSINDEWRCLYHGPNGLMCAAGCLMLGSEDTSSFEGTSIPNPSAEDTLTHKESAVLDALERGGVPRTCEALNLVSDLQDLHDNDNPREWLDALRYCAEACSLNATVVDKFAKKKT